MIVLDDLFVRFRSARSVGVGHDCVSAGSGMPALSVRHVSDVSLEVASCCLARLTRPVIASASSYWVVVCRCSRMVLMSCHLSVWLGVCMSLLSAAFWCCLSTTAAKCVCVYLSSEVWNIGVVW